MWLIPMLDFNQLITQKSELYKKTLQVESRNQSIKFMNDCKTAWHYTTKGNFNQPYGYFN